MIDKLIEKYLVEVDDDHYTPGGNQKEKADAELAKYQEQIEKLDDEIRRVLKAVPPRKAHDDPEHDKAFGAARARQKQLQAQKRAIEKKIKAVRERYRRETFSF